MEFLHVGYVRLVLLIRGLVFNYPIAHALCDTCASRHATEGSSYLPAPGASNNLREGLTPEPCRVCGVGSQGHGNDFTTQRSKLSAVSPHSRGVCSAVL